MFCRKLKAQCGKEEIVEKRFALLIDADNVSAKYIKPILDELAKYGNVTRKRIYGDWTNTQNSSWKDELLKNSITPIQQFSYTQGKNATDSAMIIDAMDILYTGSVDGFCIISSDSDFTRLASRLRESGLTVVGMGEEKTPQPFRKACDIFTSLELLVQEAEEEEGQPDIADKKVLEEVIVKIITENQNSGRETVLSEVGNHLVKLYPDFDVRSYGYSLLSKMMEQFSKIKMIKSGNIVSVVLNEDSAMREQAESYIIKTVKEQGDSGIELGLLGQRVYEHYDNFNVQHYGYSQFSQYVKNIDGIKVVDKDSALRAYYTGGKK